MNKYISNLMKKLFLIVTCLCLVVSPVSAQLNAPQVNSPAGPYTVSDAAQCTELLAVIALLVHPATLQCAGPAVGGAIRTAGISAVDANAWIAARLVMVLGLPEGAITGADLIGLTILLAGLTGDICPIPAPVILAKVLAYFNQLSGISDFVKKQINDRLNSCSKVLSGLKDAAIDCAYLACNHIQDPVHQPKAPSPVNLGDGPGVLYGKTCRQNLRHWWNPNTWWGLDDMERQCIICCDIGAATNKITNAQIHQCRAGCFD